MTEETTPDLTPEEYRAAVQDAVDAAALTYANDASSDPDHRVREELRSRGLDVDDGWVTEAAANIRSGRPVVVGADDQHPEE